MNFAGVRQLPVVFVCDNNQWAYSTPTHLEYAVEHLADRAQAYGFEGVVVDGTDVLAVYREAKRAIEKAREGGGPTLIECLTLRMEGHAVHDDAFYVPKELFEQWAERDPIERYRTLAARARRADRRRGGRDRVHVKKHLNDALERAEASPLPDPATLLEGVYADARGPRHAAPQVAMAEKTYLQAISDGLRQEMRHDKRVFVIGEDIGVYGGAFKVTLGFQEEFGAWRVIDAPLSETAIVGGATGAAMMGMRPVAEMQFADFVSCAWDHLVTVAAKQHWRAGTPVPITLRLPSGGGFSGGPFHSQNPESIVRAHPRAQVRLPGDARGREGADRLRDRGSEPGALLRAQAPLPADQGRGAGRALHDADRRGAHPPRGRRRHRRHLGRDGLHGRRGGATQAGRPLGRDRRPAHGPAVGQGGRARVGAQDVEGARAPRGHAHRRLRRRDRGDDRRGGLRGPRRAAEARSPRPTRRYRSRPCSSRRSSRRSPTSSPRSASWSEY